MKTLLKKIVGGHRLTFEELSTVLAEAEATLNSRPLSPVYSTSPEGTTTITAGHFIIGRPLRATPVRVNAIKDITRLRCWN